MRIVTRTPLSERRMSLTPVIDVVFLLLLFFMLSSTFSKFAHVEVGIGGRTASNLDLKSMPIVLLSVQAGGDFSINGTPVSLGEIRTAISSAASEGKARILVRPAADARAEDIIRAIEHSQATRLGPVILVK